MDNSFSPAGLDLRNLRRPLMMAGAFSLFINLMLLAPVLYMLQVFDRVLASQSVPTLMMLTSVVAIALIAMAGVDWARAKLLMALGAHLDEQLAHRLLQQSIAQAQSRGDTSGTDALRDIAVLRGFLSGSHVISLFDAPWLFVFLGIIYLFHPLLGAAATAGSLLLVLLAWQNDKRHRAALDALQSQTRKASHWLNAGLRNVEVLNSMGMASSFVNGWRERNQPIVEQTLQTQGGLAATHSTSKLVRQGIQIAMMALGVYLVIHDHVSPGVMIATTVLLGRAMAPVESLIGNWSGLSAARSAWARLQPQLKALERASPVQPLPPLRGEIELVNASVQSPDRQQVILKPVNLRLGAGKSLALLGPSGSGKSTLARLLAAASLATDGEVRFDGAKLDQWNEDALNLRIGYLPQDVELFPGTVAENIGRLSIDDRQAILTAAQEAGITEMILRLPKGFETPIGPGGVRISSGQAQRIGLARALYQHPAIVVLDEPNANLDSTGEDALIKTLQSLRERGCTTVMVTHKPSLVAGLDYTAVLSDGGVQVMGPTGEVLRRLGVQTLQSARELRA